MSPVRAGEVYVTARQTLNPHSGRYSRGGGRWRRPQVASVRIELPLPCQTCGSREPVSVRLDADWYEWVCPSCGTENQVLTSVDWSKGQRISERSGQFARQGDYSTAIVFAAMAVEAEMARLFVKWRRIDQRREMMRTEDYPRMPISEDDLEDEYRTFARTAAERLDRIGRLLDPRGLESFIRGSEFAETIETSRFPSLNVPTFAEDVQRAVFWRRNRVVHFGFTGHGETDANGAIAVADLTIDLLKAMDQARRR